MLFEEVPSACDLSRFARLLLQNYLVGEGAELVGEELKQTHGGLIFAAVDHRGFDIAPRGFVQIEIEAPNLDLLYGTVGFQLSRWFEEDLTRLEISDDILTDFYSH